MVFEGAFEKIFSIIKEEGGSDGGVVVQVIILSVVTLLGLFVILSVEVYVYFAVSM